ncbi:MAG TPA: DUF2231 domain-containing protein [Thermoanaerobaculia bacterium]|nr:DUF2231 domain-containing protein [Thermoanaerobaculia bacterium]
MAYEALLKAIDGQPGLEELANVLQKAVRGALPREVKNALHGIWLGHPLHPALVDVPLGAWTVALVLDALESLSGRSELREGADAAVAIGLVGAVGAAVTGLTDWSETDERGKRVGAVHGLLNVAAAAMYATSYALRKRKSSRQTAVSLSMLGYAVSMSAAYLGGHLVFGEQVGVDHTATADQKKPEKYTAVMAADDLAENKPTRAEANGVAIVLVKRGEDIYALTATCPHLGGPLDEGKIVGDAIQCPWHNSELALEDGHVVNGPTTFPARCFDVRVRKGQIEVRAAQ